MEKREGAKGKREVEEGRWRREKEGREGEKKRREVEEGRGDGRGRRGEE